MIARLESPAIHESSGLAASLRRPGIYWTHNDSGSGPLLYAFDSAGRSHGRWEVEGVRPRDWEALSAGPGPSLYIGDIGDNERTREEIVVYRLPEPDAAARTTAAKRAEKPAALRLRYPDGPHNAEALLVHPKSGDLYIITKAQLGDPETAVYKAAAPVPAGRLTTLRKVHTLHLRRSPLLMLLSGGVTGADVSPDGRRVALVDYTRAYELALPQDQPFDEIWKQAPVELEFGERKQGESIAYRRDGLALLGTSEGLPCPLIEMKRRNAK